MNFAGCWTCWTAGCQSSSVCPVSRCKFCVSLQTKVKRKEAFHLFSLNNAATLQ